MHGAGATVVERVVSFLFASAAVSSLSAPRLPSLLLTKHGTAPALSVEAVDEGRRELLRAGER